MYKKEVENNFKLGAKPPTIINTILINKVCYIWGTFVLIIQCNFTN